jgi:hypothetical protein
MMDSTCAMQPTTQGCPAWLANTPFGCCDAEDECVPNGTPVGGGVLNPGICCHGEGDSCEDTSDCCPQHACNTMTNECEECGHLHEEPTAAGCCIGLEDRGGECVAVCEETPEDPCTPCPALPDMGEWRCDDETGDECDPPAVMIEDDCDGVDNDCDEAVDEDWGPSSCEYEPEGCTGGEFPGVTRCVGENDEVCFALPGSYCRYDFDTRTFTGDAEACRWHGYDCESGGSSVCPPGTFCLVNDCWTTGMLTPHYICWGLDAPYPNSCNPPGDYTVENGACEGAVCWEPGDGGGGTSCP